jgi:hypothetical protein
MNGRYGRSRRNSKGDILILVCMCFLLIALSILIAYTFCGLYFVNNRLQASADEIALAGARQLNDKDRLGQMNNMIARCRQLVFSSRDDYEKTKADYPDLEAFSNDLWAESRNSAADLEAERQNVTNLAQKEATTLIQERFDELVPTYPMTLPWMKIGTPQLDDAVLGKIKGVDSNVTEFTQFNQLQQDDRGQGYVTTGPAINLYAAEKDEKLQRNDTDLTFKLSSLPAQLNGETPQARVLLPQNLEQVTPGYAPSAAQVKLSLRVQTGLGAFASGVMQVAGTAQTTGSAGQL